MARIVVGISGGVDSSVAAHLLKEQGHDLLAVFMINWHDTTGLLEGDCPAEDDRIVAELVARHLDIPFQVVDFSREYRQRVVDYMFAEYERGRTPNPDVLCNREVKFDLFLKKALELGADYVATGHYCRKLTDIMDDQPQYRLLTGVDQGKDQSYFLCQLTQAQLAPALFPLGDLTKQEVREIATTLNLPTSEKRDSYGICFVGKVELPVFLQQKLSKQPGNIVELPKDLPIYQRYAELMAQDDRSPEGIRRLALDFAYHPKQGRIVGRHDGAHFYTIGQRRGLNVGGMQEPLYVTGSDIKRNIVYTGQGQNHPGLYRKALYIPERDLHYLHPAHRLSIGESRRVQLRIRHLQPLQDGVIYRFEDGLYAVFDKPQRGIASGQFAAWHQNDELQGSGVITARFSLNKGL